MVAEDDVPRLLAADVAAASRASPRARSGRRPAVRIRPSPASSSLRSRPRLDMTVATTAPPRSSPRRCRSSAISAISWSPSMIRPFSSTTIRRSASPSSAMPMSAPLATTVSCSSCGWVEPQSVVDVEAVGLDAERDDVGAQLPQGLGRDMVGGAVGAIDDDLEAVEPQPLREGRLGDSGCSGRGRRRCAGRGRSCPAVASFGALLEPLLDRLLGRRRSACSRRGRTA